MNPTLRKSLDDVLQIVAHDTSLVLLACTGCPVGMKTAGPAEIEALARALQAKHKKVLAVVNVEMVCNKALTGSRLMLLAETLQAADAVLVSSCGVGVQATAAMVGRRAVPVLNTIHLGGLQGLFPSDERCAQCGNCVLYMTGGICPYAACTKGLSNGTCGGTNKGMCEVSPEKPCGWHLIYERLKELGRLDLYAAFISPRDHSKMDMPFERRKSTLWALEAAEQSGKEGKG